MDDIENMFPDSSDEDDLYDINIRKDNDTDSQPTPLLHDASFEELFNLKDDPKNTCEISAELGAFIEEKIDEELRIKEAQNIYDESNNMVGINANIKEELISQFDVMREVQVLPKGILLFSLDKCLTSFKLEDLEWPGKHIKSSQTQDKILKNLTEAEITDYILKRKFKIIFTNKTLSVNFLAYMLKRLCCTFNKQVSAIQDILIYHAYNSYVEFFPIILTSFPAYLKNLGAEITQYFPDQNFPSLICSPTKSSGDIMIPESFPFENVTVLLNILEVILKRVIEEKVDFSSKIDNLFNKVENLILLLLGIGLDRTYMEYTSHQQVTATINKLLLLYPEDLFLERISDLVEKIVEWIIDTADCFDHHTCSFICSQLLPKSFNGMTLSSSLAYYFLQCFFDVKEKFVCDIVLVEDVWLLLKASIDILNCETNCFIIHSYLLLIDGAIRAIDLNMEAKLQLQNICETIQILFKSKVDPLSPLEQRKMWGLFKMLLQKWDKMSSYETIDDVSERLKFI